MTFLHEGIENFYCADSKGLPVITRLSRTVFSFNSSVPQHSFFLTEFYIHDVKKEIFVVAAVSFWAGTISGKSIAPSHMFQTSLTWKQKEIR